MFRSQMFKLCILISICRLCIMKNTTIHNNNNIGFKTHNAESKKRMTSIMSKNILHKKIRRLKMNNYKGNSDHRNLYNFWRPRRLRKIKYAKTEFRPHMNLKPKTNASNENEKYRKLNLSKQKTGNHTKKKLYDKKAEVSNRKNTFHINKKTRRKLISNSDKDDRISKNNKKVAFVSEKNKSSNFIKNGKNQIDSNYKGEKSSKIPRITSTHTIDKTDLLTLGGLALTIGTYANRKYNKKYAKIHKNREEEINSINMYSSLMDRQILKLQECEKILHHVVRKSKSQSKQLNQSMEDRVQLFTEMNTDDLTKYLNGECNNDKNTNNEKDNVSNENENDDRKTRILSENMKSSSVSDDKKLKLKNDNTINIDK